MEEPSRPPHQAELLRSLYQELKRRSVLRVGGLYIVAAWVAIQASDILYQPLGLERSPVRLIFVAALIGFPVALAAAWFFNVTRDRHESSSALTRRQSRLALIGFSAMG